MVDERFGAPGNEASFEGMGELAMDRSSYTADDWKRVARDCEVEVEEFPEERIDAWCDAGHAWTQAGKLDEAERCYRRAAAETPGEGMPDPRVHLADFLIDHRDAEDEGKKLLDEIWRSRPRSVGTYYFAAENLETRGSYEPALNWANAGLSRCYPQLLTPDPEDLDSDFELSLLLGTRRRLRQKLEQPEDELDRLPTQALPTSGEALEPPENEATVSLPDVVLYWPNAEFDEVAEKLPNSAGPEGHAGHRRDVEAFLRECVGRAPLVVSGRLADFLQFCREASLGPSVPASRTEYAWHLVEDGGGTSWPPGRNDTCWCGSERKYKKCCGAPGFADGEFVDG